MLLAGVVHGVDEGIVGDPDGRGGITFAPDLVPLTVDEDLGVDPLADAGDERTVRDQHGELRGPPVFVSEFQGREFPLLLERGLVANEAWGLGAVAVAQKLVVLSAGPERRATDRSPGCRWRWGLRWPRG